MAGSVCLSELTPSTSTYTSLLTAVLYYMWGSPELFYIQCSRAQLSHSGHPAWLPTPSQFWAPAPPEGNVVAINCQMLVVRTPPGSEQPILASVAIVSVIVIYVCE